MIEIFSVMHTLRVPPVLIDLSMLIYHFIFVFIGQAIAIHNAQTIRHGYTSFKRSLNSMAMLGAMLFIRAWKEAEDLIIAMDSRCYDGKLELPGPAESPKTGGNCVHRSLSGSLYYRCNHDQHDSAFQVNDDKPARI